VPFTAPKPKPSTRSTGPSTDALLAEPIIRASIRTSR
jgi:hypothetical protein